MSENLSIFTRYTISNHIASFEKKMFETPCVCKFAETIKFPHGLESAVYYANTAAILGVPCNRVNARLLKGDTAFVTQLMGGRLLEGAITLS